MLVCCRFKNATLSDWYLRIFFFPGEYLYTSVDTNITFSIPKLPDHFYTVVSPTGKSILEVQGKHVIVNNDEQGRYKIKTTAQHFVISVHNVRQVDGGMFKAKNSELLEGECVVVFVTGKLFGLACDENRRLRGILITSSGLTREN